MNGDLVYLLIFILLSSTLTVNGFSNLSSSISYPAPPSIEYLMEDTITYFSVPDNSELDITLHHIWMYGNTTFRVFNETGNVYVEIIFGNNESDITKKIFFRESGVYKMVAFGTGFSYDLNFKGRDYDWKFVITAFPHKGLFRLREGDSIKVFFKVRNKVFRFYATEEFDSPRRDGFIDVYDDQNNKRAGFHLISNNLDSCFQQSIDLERDIDEDVFWYSILSGGSGGSAKLGLWINQSDYSYPTGLCTFITTNPEYYFTPSFKERNIEVKVNGETSRVAYTGAAGYPYLYTDIVSNSTSELSLKTFNKYVSWRWREREANGNPRNDDNDPFHINWDGFNFDSFDERFSFFKKLGIQPILNLEWSNDCFLSKHPSMWNEDDIQEYAEFCLATVIHCVAPDLEEPPINRSPYSIIGIQILGEPNILLEEKLDIDSALEKYIDILRVVSERIKSYPDERVRSVKIVVPGIGSDELGEYGKVYWISNILRELGDYIDIVSWDEYYKWMLEELDNYGSDVREIVDLMARYRYDKEVAMSEFNLRGGIPTSQYFFGSRYSELYLFGAIANSVNNGMKYAIYYSLVDSWYEPRFKGLISSQPMPPYSTIPFLTRKPQFYSMKILGEICKGFLLDLSYDVSQFDCIASYDNGVYRMGLSNRYESTSIVKIDLDEDFKIKVYSVNEDSVDFLYETRSSSPIVIPPWSMYYIEGNLGEVKSDLNCNGELIWRNVKPNSVLDGYFYIENIGDPFSMLNWSIIDYPSWGNWSFNPSNGRNLTPIGSPIRVNVTVVIPDERNKVFNGYITISNLDDRNDICKIPVVASTSKLFNRISFINKWFILFGIEFEYNRNLWTYKKI